MASILQGPLQLALYKNFIKTFIYLVIDDGIDLFPTGVELYRNMFCNNYI